MHKARYSRNRIVLVVVLVLVMKSEKSRTKDEDENDKFVQTAKTFMDGSRTAFGS